MIELVNISKKIGYEYILKNINLKFHKNNITGIISLNSSETSNLLKIISGHIIPYSGNIIINNKEYKRNKESGYDVSLISSCFGFEKFFPYLSTIDNFFIGNLKNVTKFGIISKSTQIKKVKGLLEEFNFQYILNKQAYFLSKEEKSLLSIIKLLLDDSEFYVIDKTTYNISIECYDKFKKHLKKLKEKEKGIIFVPDNPNQIFDICDNIVVLRNGENVFYEDVKKTSIDEIYNIMNNTQYTINQEIKNKFYQYNANVKNFTNLIQKTIKLIENFCNLNSIFIIYQEFNKKFNIAFSDDISIIDQEFLNNNIENILNTIKNNKINIRGNNYIFFEINKNSSFYSVLFFLSKKGKYLETLKQILNEFSICYQNIYEKILIELRNKQKEIDDIAIKKELDIAKNIQLSLLPKIPSLKEYEISAKMIPAEDVGGDYYDFINFQNRLWIGIGDVSGHGLKSGLIMMMAQTAFSTILLSHPNISNCDLIKQVNKVIYDNVHNRLQDDNFMTLSFFCADNNGNVLFSGCHLDIIIYRYETKEIENIPTNGFWLGIIPELGEETIDYSFKLNKNDILILYTDGLIEAHDKINELYGLQRLTNVIIKFSDSNVENIRDSILDDVFHYLDKQKDDITLLVIKKN